MSQDQVHYELFVRRTGNAPWTLDCASEDRERMVLLADEMMTEGRVAAVKLCKELMNPESGEFRSVTILARGQVEMLKRRKEHLGDNLPLCVSPSDLYTVHARERIGRLLETWLLRKKVTAFELMHRPDLVEQLDASGVEIQHAVQKISVPEAQHRGVGVHEVIRGFQKLIDQTIERLLSDSRRGVFPVISPQSFAEVTERLADDPDRNYVLGGAIAAYLAPAVTGRAKVGRLLDLADRATSTGRGRTMAFQVLEQPLSELLGSRGGLSDLVSEELDLGSTLAVLTRLAAGRAVTSLEPYDPLIARWIPRLEGEAKRLEEWIERDAFEDVRGAISRRVLHELTGPRRLKPGDPEAEIALLRALAMALTSASGKLLPLEDVQAAFNERSRTLMGGEFVEAFLAGCDGPLAEAQALVRLAENVVGGGNKRSAGRWLAAKVSALKFETELRAARESPATRLAALAELQRAVGRAGMQEAEQACVVNKLGEVGGLIEADAKLSLMIGRAPAPIHQRLIMLLKLASGEGAPLGPAADRARAEALRLVRSPEARTALSTQPEMLERVRGLMMNAGVAA